MEDLKYPIAYAPMPIKKFVGWESEKPIYRIYCYIASPCYILSETKNYGSDGSVYIDYKIVFCEELSLQECKKVVPEFNIYNSCTNSIIENEVDCDFSKIFELCEKKNHELELFCHFKPDSTWSKEQFHEDIHQFYRLLDCDYEKIKSK